jgi:phosphohistidine swiveling domain-containing protein
MNKIPVTKENSIFTFASEGTTFFFQDMVFEHYELWNSLRVCKGSHGRVFVPKEMVEKMHAIGRAMTPEFIREKVKVLEESSKFLSENLPKLQATESLTLEQVNEYLDQLNNICRNYSSFDIHYSDGMKVNGEITPTGKVIEETKNVVRESFNESYFEKGGFMSVFLAKLANQFSLSVEDIEWYTEAEVLQLFEGKYVEQEELAERRIAYVQYTSPDLERTLIVGKEALAYYEQFEDTEPVAGPLKGVVAHKSKRKGNVTGKVKILKRDYADSSYLMRQAEIMEEGTILVTDTTDPEFLPAMRKSEAVITDAGGILSHAAITSRELDITCIVGTVSATQVLKDGDLVEVDADNGIVKIVEKV